VIVDTITSLNADPRALSARAPEGALRRIPWAAALLPLVVYVWTAAGHGYWLDSAEFSAAAIELDIAHPPGHPLFGLWSKPFTWLPVGPLPFRVAVGQAVAAALSLWFVARALLRSVRLIGIESARLSALLALSLSYVLGSAYGYWFQAVRAEVYALEALLVCIAFERISHWACQRDDPRALWGACFALGLGLANHHFIAVLAMPVLLWPAHDALRRRGALATGFAFGALGLVCYLYLPLRALSEPPMDLGHPVSWRDFWWVISAQVYARKIGSGAMQPLSERFADLLIILYEQFNPLVLGWALVGGYALLRQRRLWPLAALWWPAALFSLCGRAWLNEVRSNPDVLGYMMPGFAALVGLSAAGWSVIAAGVSARWRNTVSYLFGGALAMLALAQFTMQCERASLASFHDTDAFDDLRRRAMPTRSLIILTTPETVFRHWEGEAVEQLRGDITMVPLPFLGYGGSDAVLLRRHPELATLLSDFARDGALSSAALRELARARPVFVELDSSTTLPLYAELTPDALLYRFASPSPALNAARVGLEERVSRDPETVKALLWPRYVDSLYYAARGERARALRAVTLARKLAPQARELVALQRALEQRQQGPLDLGPFLPR
jgi:Protein of unknown function (DUF2723)